MDIDTLYQSNLAFFKRQFPALHDRLTAIPRLISRVVHEEGVVVDIDLGQQRLYNGDARTLSEGQVEYYLNNPLRLNYKSVEGLSSDSIISMAFFEQLREWRSGHPDVQLSADPDGPVGFQFILGLGLGYHLAPLVDATHADNVVVIEAVDEFVLHSMRAVDWSDLHSRMTERGQVLHIIVEKDPAVMEETVLGLISRQSELLLDGTYFYRHYPFWSLQEAFTRLMDRVPLRMTGRGYYEDERKMIRNAATNLHKVGHYLVRGRFRRRYDVPAFIIGAGPSLDQDIEFIRKWKDHVIVFCAGTTIQALIKAGIVPDYHVELENVTIVHPLCMHTLQQRPDLFPEQRFTGMKLLASATVNPMVPPLFDEHYFFYRDSVSSTSSFGEGIEIMSGVGPTISNTCISLAARLGFETMYLFGVDCGWRDGRNHHSKDTMYYTMEGAKRELFTGEYSVPGNFGGMIQADMVLSWTRDLIEQKAAHFGLKIFNCSDGAFIRGTTPKLAESLFFPGPPLDKEAIFQRIRDESEYFAPGEFLKNHDMDRYGPEIDALEKDFNAFLDDFTGKEVSFHDFLLRLTDFDQEGYKGAYRHIYTIYQGSINGFVKAAAFYMNRLPHDLRQSFFTHFLGVYRSTHGEIFEEGRVMFAEAKTMVEGGPEPEWADGKPRVPGTTY